MLQMHHQPARHSQNKKKLIPSSLVYFVMKTKKNIQYVSRICCEENMLIYC